MALNVTSITCFREDIGKLKKKEKDGYYLCQVDISNKLSALSFEDIWELSFRVRDMSGARVIKIRLRNSHSNLSASEGFRLYMLCRKKDRQVILLTIYPKIGSLRQDDVGKERLSYLLKQAAEELRQHSLEPYIFS